ncbi:MAG: hypothetical protein R3Y58_12020 [Eubacteriales bacterium]
MDSAEQAKNRLQFMNNKKPKSAIQSPDFLTNGTHREFNAFPADNNKYWDNDHNKLSSKGD